MTMTKSQQLAQAAYPVVQKNLNDEFRSFALSFPALIHSAGLAQAVIFAQNKNADYLKGLDEVLWETQDIQKGNLLAKLVRECDVQEYTRLSRRTIEAASWLKRYVQALAAKD